jgi:16S rRNA (adenine1518-N6/adenine1519-N6)-dimethyltransferase
MSGAAGAPGATLLGASDIRRLATSLDLRPTKSLGQNFLIDANTARRIVRAARLVEGSRVLEVGPGLGSLTLALLDAGHPVTAVEIDERLAGALPGTAEVFLPDRADALQVVTADALQIVPAALGPGEPPTALVANLPYNVAVPVLLNVVERFPSIERGLVMVQAEVAARLVAPAGSKVYGAPSVKLAWYAASRSAGAVGRTVFWPAPHVDSSLVAFERRTPPAGDRKAVFRVVDAAFAQRRKTIRAALAGVADRPALEAALAASAIDPATRGEALTVTDFARLAAALGG